MNNDGSSSSTSESSYAAHHASSVLSPQEKTEVEPLSPEEIKAIGEIELGPSKHEVFLNNHYKKLLWGGIILGIAAGSIIAYFSHENDVRQAAGAEVVAAMGTAGPTGVTEPAAFDSAALGKLDTEYAATPSHETAQLLQGMKELTGAKPEDGVKTLEELAAASQDIILQSRALATVAGYYLSEGKDAESAAAWEKVIALGNSPYTALAYLTLGDLARNAGDTEKARDAYKQAETKCPTSPLVTGKTVQMHALLLDVDAPQHVAAPEQKSDNPFGDAPATENSGSSASDSLDSLMTQPAQQ